LHAGAMLSEVGVKQALIPRYPGVTSAMGCVIADMRQDFVQTINATVDRVDADALAAFMQSHIEQGVQLQSASKTRFESTQFSFELDMAYAGQTHTVPVPISVTREGDTVVPLSRSAISDAFLRTLVSDTCKADTNPPQVKSMRQVHFGTQWHETSIYDRLQLPVGSVIVGPAILEQPDTTVLIEQNDFLHPDGAYGRAKQGCDAITALPNRVAPLIHVLRQHGGTYISAQFTLVPRPDGEPLIAPHLKALRPFLGKGDFQPGRFGHALVDTLAPADYTVEKVNYSAFFQTRLEYIVQAIASTLRDAHLRNIDTLMLSDGCAAFDDKVHEATLLSLRTVTHQMRCDETLKWMASMA